MRKIESLLNRSAKIVLRLIACNLDFEKGKRSEKLKNAIIRQSLASCIELHPYKSIDNTV